jgi:hypothetical protein
MRRCCKPMAFLSILASFALLSLPAGAQETRPKLFLMADALIDVSRAGEYEAALQDLIAALASSSFPVLFDTYATDDSHYFVIYGLDNFASVDVLNKAWQDVASRLGPARYQALHARLTAAEISRVLKFWTFRPDISFLPVPERLKPGEFAYYNWDFVSVIPGKEAEFEALNREWIALSAAKKTRDPFLTYRGGIGTDQPVYVWFEYGKSASDYALAEEKYWQALGTEGAALSKRTRALIKRMETKTGRYRPDLSYTKR